MTMLATLGVDAVYGVAHDRHPVVEVPIDLAWCFAEAHRRVTGRPAGTHDGTGMIIDVATGDPARAFEPPGRWLDPPDELLDALRRSERPAVLAGPGVIDADAVADLHAFAVAGSLGVLNTWGAKGVFDWRSRHHLATVGLQARDFGLGGFADADLIVAVGVDEREALADWRLAPTVTLAPAALGPTSEVWSRPRSEIGVPPLRTGLADITQRGWARHEAPLAPTKLTQHYSEVLGGTGLVAADPGTVGYWVARTFGTTGLGGAQVPNQGDAAGFAVAAASVARMRDPNRTVLAVVDSLDGRSRTAIEVAESMGVRVPVEIWDPDGEHLDAPAHLDRLRRLVVEGGTETVAFDPTQLDEMIAFAGPVVAWTV